MVRDTPSQIINESIKRLTDQSMELMDDVRLLEELPDCSLFKLVSPDQLRRMAALGIAMMRITESAEWN